MGGVTSLRKSDDLSYFRSPDIDVRIIDVSDSRSFTLVALQSTFDVWLGFWMPMVRATKNLSFCSTTAAIGHGIFSDEISPKGYN